MAHSFAAKEAGFDGAFYENAKWFGKWLIQEGALFVAGGVRIEYEAIGRATIRRVAPCHDNQGSDYQDGLEARAPKRYRKSHVNRSFTLMEGGPVPILVN
ncbi:MAG: hypothetical protein AMXMBFR82_37940 [Candidatus Hydrogenedentota bacterium]